MIHKKFLIDSCIDRTVQTVQPSCYIVHGQIQHSSPLLDETGNIRIFGLRYLSLDMHFAIVLRFHKPF